MDYILKFAKNKIFTQFELKALLKVMLFSFFKAKLENLNNLNNYLLKIMLNCVKNVLFLQKTLNNII
jgi:hypothetical protein